MPRRIIPVSTAMLVMGGPLCLAAQQPSAASIGTEVQQAVRSYVDALNKADAATLVEMYSREAGVTSVGDGQITRGWDAIRSTVDSIAGAEGKYRVATGSIDVIPLGSSYALALTSTILTVKSGDQAVQLRGAMTLVFKRIGAEWKIIHDHTSTVTPMTPTASAAAAPQPAAPAAEEPMRFAIADEVVIVRQGHYRSYQFSVSIPAPCTVRGQIVGLAGGNKDFQASIMDKDNFLNWKTNHEAQVYWLSGQVAATDLGVRLNGPTTYYLVISNLFSRFTAKTVKVQAFTEC